MQFRDIRALVGTAHGVQMLDISVGIPPPHLLGDLVLFLSSATKPLDLHTHLLHDLFAKKLTFISTFAPTSIEHSIYANNHHVFSDDLRGRGGERTVSAPTTP